MTMTIEQFVIDLQNKFPAIEFYDSVFKVLEGKRYWKIVRHDKVRDLSEGCSVYAFIDKNTGDLYKPASFNAPAKHVRGNINDVSGLDACEKYSVKYLR